MFGFVATSLVHIVREDIKRGKHQPVQYQVPMQQLSSADGYMMPPVEYKVLDEFPTQPYVYGAELKDQTAVEQDEEPVGMPK